MRLSDAELARLMPSWLREDAYDVAVSRVVDAEVRAMWPASRLLTTWDRLDELPDAELDRLASELHVEWYDSGADRAARVEAIRTSDLIHAKKGTVEAIERLVDIYFGGGRVSEWPEYGGRPHHFRVRTGDPTAVAQNLTRFAYFLELVKRHSSKLDAIVVELQGTARGRAGAALADSARVAAVLDVEGMRGTGRVPIGCALVVRDRIAIRMHAGMEG